MTILCRAYVDLSTCRTVGLSIGPIPWRDVMAWCDRRGFDQLVTDHVWAVVQHVDRETLRRAAERVKNKTPT